MKRRNYLATGGSILTASMSGCLGLFEQTEEKKEDSSEPQPPSNRRVDEPSYNIKKPIDDPNKWNPHYLGTNLASSPTIEYSTDINANLTDKVVSVQTMDKSNEYSVRVINSEEKMNNILSNTSNLNINFDEEALIVIESGYGSSSLIHQWKRVEETANGIHLYGYIYRPYNRRLDFKSISSLVKVNKPNVESIIANVSLTVGKEFRINFDSSEDVVGIDVLT